MNARHFVLILLVCIAASAPAPAPAQELALRVRVAHASPRHDRYSIDWRCGGEGLGGERRRGTFTSESSETNVTANAWTSWLPVRDMTGGNEGSQFPTIVVSPDTQRRRNRRGEEAGLTDVRVEFEFKRGEATIASFTEDSPRGSTVSFALPQIQGLSSYVRARREHLEKLFPNDDGVPRQFAIFGRSGGYGEGAGRGIRHCNPDIAADELRCMHLLGMNSLVQDQSEKVADAANAGEQFRRMYWGRLGGSGKELPPGDCPFADSSRKSKQPPQEIIDESHRIAARASWAQRGDEIGVAAKEHLLTCPRCRAEFRKYLQAQNVPLAELGVASWEEVNPYPSWPPGDASAPRRARRDAAPATAPSTAADALRYYFTYRFMTVATAPQFAPAAAQLKSAGIPMFSLLAPTPSWSSHSLDWHEFFDLDANTAIVFETSNTDPQVWQFESYLADIARGIARRHDIPMGCLVKPQRGAPAQRMLSVVARGATAIEWYTYGPDYSKADSFSQSPQLLEAVGKADRFLAACEDRLYGAHWANEPEVALVLPRSSEIWDHSRGEQTSVENAKWLYLALAHSHIPLDVLSEQQLAEGKLERFKVIYLVGANLRRDAAVKLAEWVRAGGTLWTDALGASRDEANQPLAIATDLFGRGERHAEMWSTVPPYRAINLQPFDESNAPAHAAFEWHNHRIGASVGREIGGDGGWDVEARFADDRPALLRRAVGAGAVISARFFAGLTYSATVRRSDFDMRRDFDANLRALIASAASERDVTRPAVPDDALVEAIVLENDGHKNVALMNWGYRKNGDVTMLDDVHQLHIALPAKTRSARSIRCGPLPLDIQPGKTIATLSNLQDVDALVIE